MPKPDEVTAADMARANAIDPSAFRKALRRERLRWHQDKAPWTVLRTSPEHHDMLRVLKGIAPGQAGS